METFRKYRLGFIHTEIPNSSSSDAQLTKQIEVLNTGFANAAVTYKLAGTTRTQNSDWFKIAASEGDS